MEMINSMSEVGSYAVLGLERFVIRDSKEVIRKC